MRPKSVRYTREQMTALKSMGADKTDWARVRAMTDAEIDFSDSPEISPEQFAKAVIHMALPLPKQKARLTMRLDSDILDWFKSQGRGYQTKINALLRAYKDAHAVRP